MPFRPLPNRCSGLTTGLILMPHGAQKLFGWFGGYGVEGTGQYFATQLHLPASLAVLAGLIEFFGGLALAAGFATRAAAALVVGMMTVAIVCVHLPNGFFWTSGGFEYPLLWDIVALYFVVRAEWVILVTSLAPEAFSTADVLALYRLRWRIELGFKRLKNRSEGTARRRRTLRQNLSAGPSLDHPSARAAHRRTRGLSPLGRGLGPGRLTRPDAWRLLRQLVASLLQAIMPEPTLACLRGCLVALRRHLREPPRRKGAYQRMVPLC